MGRNITGRPDVFVKTNVLLVPWQCSKWWEKRNKIRGSNAFIKRYSHHLISSLVWWSQGCFNITTKYCTFSISNNLKQYNKWHYSLQHKPEGQKYSTKTNYMLDKNMTKTYKTAIKERMGKILRSKGSTNWCEILDLDINEPEQRYISEFNDCFYNLVASSMDDPLYRKLHIVLVTDTWLDYFPLSYFLPHGPSDNNPCYHGI